MAANGASSTTSRWRYHVFLSFRGEDTRKGFTDHLYAALWRKGIVAFRDDQALEKGEVIEQELLRAIQESLSAIVILSQNYASSTWCLDELLKILESKRVLGREVFPIFHGVDPSDVRNQSSFFAQAFEKHEANFGEDKEKVQNWRNALIEVANLCGWDTKDRHEAMLVEDVVAEVWRKVQPKLPSYDCHDLVGIDSKVEDMYSVLKLGSKDVRFVGIWGMGGIGKTTLAKTVFKKIKWLFDISCFLADVGEVSGEKNDGLVRLQKELLSDLNLRGMKIETSDQGKDSIRNQLCSLKVLLVIDDVSAKNVLENLAGDKNWFGPHSRVIITSRNGHLLKSHEVDDIYEVETFDKDEALQLFYQKAFKKNQPKLGYLRLSGRVVEYAGGLPLALEVLGSLFCKRSISEWEDALDKLKQIPPNDIMKTLRISFDSLDSEEKNIFLDIACFHNGKDIKEVKRILKCCGYHSTIGIQVLIEKSMITNHRGVLRMHDLLQQMGRDIIAQESPDNAGRRSRLWSPEDIYTVLIENKGTEAIQGLVLNDSIPDSIQLEPDAFLKMCSLKLLMLDSFKAPKSLKGLPRSLKFLSWRYYSLSFLPFWFGRKFLGMLKLIDMSDSKYLVESPDVSGVPNLESLVLRRCYGLVKLHPSLGQHKKLRKVNLESCTTLKTLPRRLEMDSLERFVLYQCHHVRNLPDFGGNMKCLKMLDLRSTAIAELPPSLGNLTGLTDLRVSYTLSRLPDILIQNEALGELDLSKTAITELPPSIALYKNLKKLSLQRCKGPEANSWNLFLPFQHIFGFRRHVIPSTFSSLSMLTELDLSYCNLSDESIPDVPGCFPSSLHKLNLSGNNFVNLPGACMSNLLQLTFLDLHDCVLLRSLPEVPKNVKYMYAAKCTSLKLLSTPELWDLFASTFGLQKWYSTGKVCSGIVVSGNKIPLWFPIRKYFDDDSSMVVDIPHSYASSAWWGIAVCILLEPNCQEVHWDCANPVNKTMIYNTGSWHVPINAKWSQGGTRLLLLFLSCENYNRWQQQRGGCNQVQLSFRTDNNLPLEMRRRAYRLLCKENFEFRHKKITHSRFFGGPSIPIHLRSHRRIGFTQSL